MIALFLEVLRNVLNKNILIINPHLRVKMLGSDVILHRRAISLACQFSHFTSDNSNLSNINNNKYLLSHRLLQL